MPSEDCEQLRGTVRSRQGQTCIYREKTLILPCTLASAIADAWGVRLTLKPIKAAGFLYPRQSPLNVSTAWGWGSIGDSTWYGGQAVGWTIYFDERLFRSLTQVALQCAELNNDDRWHRLTEHLNHGGRDSPEEEPHPDPMKSSGPSPGHAADLPTDEVNMKLDLAAAYLDMGDAVGAGRLLEDVIKAGDAAQQQRAAALLKPLG